MGIEIVKAAVVCGRDLSGNAFKALVAMSLQALDKPKDGRPAGLYFGGWASLQTALGYEPGGPETKGHTAVKRAIRELKDGQHITPMVEAARGTRQSYLIHPGGLGKGVTTDPKRGSLDDPKRGSESTPNEGHPVTLLGRTQDGEGLNQDISLTQEPKPQTAGRDEDKPHKFRGRPGNDCADCGRGYGNRAVHPMHLLRGHG